MFVAAYDDRPVLPDYFISFIRNTTAFCDLHLLTPAKKQLRSIKLDSESLKFKLRTIDTGNLPKYQYVKSLFDGIFVNYSTNHEDFERACFHRWLALNASTTFLNSNDYICLLDTDFLIGMSPSDVLCPLKGKEIQFIAEWDDESYDESYGAIGPEFTIMTKSYLYGFCEYIMATYFSPSMRSQLLTEYFQRIGNGVAGGICDMKALAAYSKLNHYDSMLNLRRLDEPTIIGNFNEFLNSEVGKTDSWKIIFQSDRQTLIVGNKSRQLIGTHFQGSAKAYIQLACGASGADGEITRSICAEHLESLAKSAKANKNLIRRLTNKFKRGI